MGRGWRNITFIFSFPSSHKGLKIFPKGLSGRIKAAFIIRDYGLDYDEALAVQALRELSAEIIVSHDEDFDSVNWIKRLEPRRINLTIFYF